MGNPWDSDPIVSPAPVYGAPDKPAEPFKAPQAQATLARTQQEVKQAEATAAANTTKANAEAQSASIAAKNAQEAYTQAHIAESPELIGLTGPALLSKLPPAEGPMVKAMIDGRMAPPTASALKDPQWQQRLKWANQVDPDFNEARWQMRVKTMGDAATGRLAQANNAINTAIGHAGLLMDQAAQPGVAGHGNWPLVPDVIPTAINAVQNAANKGNPDLSVYNDTAVKLGTEEARAYQGGAPNEGDTNRYVASLSANLPYDAKKAVIHNALELFASKTVANLSQYDFGTTGGKPPLNVLDKPALDTLQKYAPDVLDKYFYHGFIGGNSHDGGTTPPSASGPGGPSGGPPPTPNDPMVPSSGQTKDVLDPNLTPVRREYMARLAAGQSAPELVQFLRQSGADDPGLLRAAVQQAQFRDKNPNVPINQYNTSAIDHITQRMGLVNRAMNAVGQSDLGAGVAAAGNAVTGGYLPDIIGATGGNTEQARLALQYSGQDHRGSALTGGIVGGTTAALAGEAGLGGAGMGAGFGRTLAADAGYGALAGSGASPDNRLSGAVFGGLTGAAASAAGQGIAKGAAATLRGVANTDVSKLVNAGVPLTIGQAVGGKLRGAEDKIISAVGGGSIQARRAEGYNAFYAKAFDKALEPIGTTVEGQTGPEAVAAAHEKVSQAFTDALAGKTAVPDDTFIKSARGPLERLAANKRVGPEIVNEVNNLTSGLFDDKTGAMSGEHMQAFLDALQTLRRGYKSDPLYSTLIKPNIQGIENSVTDMFLRQAPEVTPAFNAAKQAYRRVSIISDAVNSADGRGLVSPQQLRRADINNAKKYEGNISAASGNQQFADLTGPASRLLPSQVPNSGSADRLATLKTAGGLSALATGGAGVGYLGGDPKTGAETGLGLAALLTALYSRRGQRILVNLARPSGPTATGVGNALQRLAPVAGGVGAALPTSSR